MLCGCKSIEGNYNPACAAFAGDTIELRDGRFTWSRFTDEVRVDDAGNRVDPFPDFPKTGGYDVDGDRITLRANSDDAPTTFTLLSSKEQLYLLTPEQVTRYADEGVVERCALVRSDAAKSET